MGQPQRQQDPWSVDQDGPGPPGRGGGPWLIAAAVAILALIGFLVWRFPNALAHREDQVHFVYMLVLLTVLGGSFILGWRGRASMMFRQAGIWLAIGAVLMLGYSYRFELMALPDRLLGELLPHRGTTDARGAVAFQASANGHFQVEAVVDGEPIRFMVDTGATDIVLTPDDARRLGFDPERLRYNQLSHTANGTVRGATVTVYYDPRRVRCKDGSWSAAAHANG